MTQHEAMFQITATATGEVRDADGNLIEQTSDSADVRVVSASSLRRYSDEELAAKGFTPESIQQIRSTS